MDEDHKFAKLNLSVTSPEDMQKRALALENARLARVHASTRASLMFGCYRKAEASDPEIYAAATAAVLSEYPQEIIDFVTDPRTGLPSTLKWLPSVFEVREACDAHKEYLAKVEQVRELRERRSRQA